MVLRFLDSKDRKCRDSQFVCPETFHLAGHDQPFQVEHRSGKGEVEKGLLSVA